MEIEVTIGQRDPVLIPEPIRDAYNLRPGMHVTFSVEVDQIVIEGATDVLDEYLGAVPQAARAGVGRLGRAPLRPDERVMC